MISWEDTLDVFEAGLGHHRQLVETEAVDGTNPWPPRELPHGPVPDDLRPRALDLLERSNLLIDDVAAKMATLPALKPSRYPHHATPDRPRWTTTL